ncbi:hypothetical protein Ahy_A09g043263 isoform A [Arachis hypogaea]|uniref:Uncharacterized protein n=1 Tax=Arachis hypogaea TaxID=3818 RepID=A0A445BHW8_ARAHY|nr:hypothetical protein Ahy_A09g043263 isoform A [Arachis hypogaea]
MFNQLSLEPHIQKEAAIALIGVIQKHENYFGGINAPLTRLAKAHANALVFRDPDSFNGEFYHNKPLGCVNTVLEVGPRKTNNKFHVVDENSRYHILLERLWIHLYRCVPSSWHQCIKGKDICFSATVTPFDAGEAHLVDMSFYEKLALLGVNKIRSVREPHIGTPRQKGA